MFRKYTVIDDLVVKGRRFLTRPMIFILSAVIFAIGLAIDPMNPFEAFYSPMAYGLMVERPAMIGSHALISLWILYWVIWGLRDGVIATLDTIAGKLSYERYRFIVDNYGDDAIRYIV